MSPPAAARSFNLQTTTAKIRESTNHLKGVKIAIMGCIVNGPGEMADADFGYVGGAPGKVNLYIGKTPRQIQHPRRRSRRPPRRPDQGKRQVVRCARARRRRLNFFDGINKINRIGRQPKF